jgi:diguanylate cyclase (GGDEF)-like protein
MMELYLLGLMTGLLIYNVIVAMFSHRRPHILHTAVTFGLLVLYGWGITTPDVPAFFEFSVVVGVAAFSVFVHQRFVLEFVTLSNAWTERTIRPNTLAVSLGASNDWFAAISMVGVVGYIVVLSVGLGYRFKVGRDVADQWSIRYREVLEQMDAMSKENDRLQKETTTDSLTKIGNRAHFDVTYQLEWDRAYRAHSNVSLPLVDIDHFKRVNDRHGHVAGDECIVAVALALRRCLLRPTDRVMRYGGEEFVIVLGNSNIEGVMMIGDRIHNAVKSLRFKEGFRICVSVGGGCTIPSDQFQSQHFLRTVDQALYEAKRLGRDRLELVDEDRYSPPKHVAFR